MVADNGSYEQMTMLSSSGMTWWRVEFGFEGEVTCTPVYAARTREDQRVWYVEAENAEGARAVAIRARARERLRERRAAYREQGLCRCGRARDSALAECATCRARQAGEARRRAERLGVSLAASKLIRGPTVTAKTRVNPGPAQAARRAGLRASERLSVLLEVRAEFERTRKTGPDRDKHFLLWLIDQIAKAQNP